MSWLLAIIVSAKERGGNPSTSTKTNMPQTKKLQKQIENKLEKLSQLIDQIEEARLLNSNDPDTWDSDALYNLVENCKEILTLLEDQLIKGKLYELGQPFYEDGLCSLMDNYWAEEEETDF